MMGAVALQECFPAGCGALGIGDGRIAVDDLLTVLDVGPHGRSSPTRQAWSARARPIPLTPQDPGSRGH